MALTDSEPKSPPRAARRRSRRARGAIAVLVIVSFAAGTAVYLTRRAIAREVLIGWLEARGVPAEVEFRDFEFGGFTARVRAGAPNDPDVSVARVEVRYGFTGFWAGEPLGVRVISVKLYRPVLKATFRDGKLSMGSLDPLIEEFTRQPPRPDAAQPRIEVHRGVLNLATDYGAVKLRGDGRLEDGKLMALDARLDPARLQGEGLAATVGEARLRVATTRDRADVLLTAPVTDLKAGALAVRNGRLRLSVQGPYPDLRKRKGDGAVLARLEVAAAGLGYGEDQLEEASLVANFNGASAGWIETLALHGDGDVRLVARRGRAAGVDFTGLASDVSLGDLRWTRTAGDVVSAETSARASIASGESGDFRFSAVRTDAGGLVAFDGKRLDLSLRGSMNGRGAWSGLGPVTAADADETTALKRALAGFQFSASSVAVSASQDELSVSLGVPARIHTDTGGDVTLYRGGGPIFSNGSGAFELRVAGGGLPQAELSVSRYRVTDQGLAATAALKAKGGFAPISDGSIEAAGDVRLAGGGVTFTAARCVPVSAAHVELGENDLERLEARLCPSGAPMLTMADGAWRLRGKAQGLAAALPSVEVRIAQGEGALDLSGRGARLNGQASLADLRVEDTAAERRFHPVRASGRAVARAGGWTGTFELFDPARRHLASGQFRHGADGRGAAEFDTGTLVFADGGLQPEQLSPLAELVASPAAGGGRFVGQVAWSPAGLTSRGDLTVDRLDFVSPMGPVVGLSGHVVFDSLAPLSAAPGQSLKAEAINTLVPLTDVDVRFGLANEALVVEGATLAVGGGALVFEPFILPFEPGAPWNGVVNFQGVQVKDLVEASPFGDRVDLEARLSGRVPFAVTPEGVRVSDGALHAIEPGRLSILREALTPVASTPAQAVIGSAVDGVQIPLTETLSGGGEVNAFSEFAYQAMEHLAFETLDAQVNSQENGRLGVLMHLKGRHDPPQKQEIRLTLMELIRRDFLNKALPLPSGTQVDLTLDTSLNLDQILKDFADFQALHGSHPVQP